MIHTKTKLAWAIAAAVTVATPISAFATNGYFMDGTSAKNRGMGGAGAALPQDALASLVNPAGMVFVGNRADLGLGVFNPNRDYRISGNGAGMNGAQDSGSRYFPIPSLGYNTMLGADTSLGVTVSGNGGMNTSYPNGVFGPFSSGKTGVDLSQMFIAGTAAHKIMPNFALGVSAIWAYQRFKAEGLQGFDQPGYTASRGNVSNNGYDNTSGFGAKIGALVDVGAGVSVGAAYSTKIKGKFDKYKGLFAEQGEFDIPSNYVLGVAWKMNPDLAFALDYMHIKYSDSKAVSNPIENFTVSGQPFGSSNGPGFGWQDIDVYKLGVQYAVNPAWTLRAGWNHGDNPIPASQVAVNILAPGVVQDHLGLGFTYKMSSSSELSFDYLHAFKKSLTGPMPTAFGGGTATIEMDQNYAEVSYGMKF